MIFIVLLYCVYTTFIICLYYCVLVVYYFYIEKSNFYIGNITFRGHVTFIGKYNFWDENKSNYIY